MLKKKLNMLKTNMDKCKIYDGFLFFNELDLLDLRLNILNDVVDYFVLVESSVTHQGESKPFIFEENKQKYQKFLEKIIHIKVTNTPEDFSNLPNQSDDPIYSQIYEQIKNTKLFNRFDKNHNGFGRDFFQKECIKLGFKNCKDDDIVISSDLDEIPNPEYLSRLNEYFSADELYTFNQTHYCFYLNMLNYSHIDNTSTNRNITTNWKGSRMGTYDKIKNYSLNELRAQNNNDLLNGGWHFSYMGGIDKVKTKLKSYSHQERNTDFNLNNFDKFLEKNINIIQEGRLELIQINDTFPKYLINNIDKFKHLIKL